MIPALLTGTLLLVLLLAVLSPALLELHRPTDVAPLNVPRDHDNAATRFALHYRERLEQLLQAPLIVTLQQPDAADRAAQKGLQWCEAGSQVGSKTRPLVGAGDLLLLPGTVHPYEVYAAGDLRLAHGARARAAFAEGHLHLDGSASVSRWAHAQTVSLGMKSLVGARVSAERQITLDSGARFVRARAPTICVLRRAGQALPGVHSPRSRERQLFAGASGARFDALGGRWTVDGDINVPAETDIQGDLIVHGDAKLATGCRVQGSIKVHGRLTLGDDCVIEGACVVVGSAQVGAEVRIAGPLVGEDRVQIGANSTIGRIDAETSVNGRLIVIEPGATVHGSIWAKAMAGAKA